MQNSPPICPQCQAPIPADAPGGLCPACVLIGVAGITNPSQVAASNTPMIDEVAAAFPDLEILERIGQGGMGVVFKARQPRLDRFVALKILPPALAAQPGFAERFTREARVLARLAHPHIVAIYDFGESAGFFYLIMEFVDGVNLRAAMRAGIRPAQALLLVPKICEALQFAHDHGVLHRDIKPENILLDTRGTPKLADFGIAKFGDSPAGLTLSGAALGTAAYMAPEQLEKPATVDHRADIYSLGVVLYEMLTGELPLGRFAAPSEKSTVNRGVDEVVMRALEKERERRQQSATAMKTEVENASAVARHPYQPAVMAPPKQKDLGVAYLLWFLFGVLGGHKFYLRKYGWGWLYFFTGGLFFFGWFIDLFTLPKQVRRFNGEQPAVPFTSLPIPAPAWNPWPKRVFLLIVALIGVPVLLGGVILLVRLFSMSPTPAIATPAPTVDVAFEGDPVHPQSQKVTVNASVPFDTLVDFSFRVRDADGERELPAYSALAAWQTPSFEVATNSGSYHVAGRWEFLHSTAEGVEFQLGTDIHLVKPFPQNSGSGPNGAISGAGIQNSGAFRGLRWEEHPDRATFVKRSLPLKIPFMIGRPEQPDAAGCELFLFVTARKMKPDEKAARFDVKAGGDRFERLADPAFNSSGTGPLPAPGEGQETIER